MQDEETECPISSGTARLSISLPDGSNARDQLRQLARGRRDSAVSFGSDDSGEKPQSGNTHHLSKPATEQKKRRTSSVTSKDPPIKKSHRRKLLKINEQPAIEIQPKGQDIVMYHLNSPSLEVFAGDSLQIRSPVRVRGAEKIGKIVTCLIGGLSRRDFSVSEAVSPPVIEFEADVGIHFPFFTETFDNGWAVKAPGDSVSLFPPMDAFTWSSLFPAERKRVLAKSKAQKITILDLLLSEADMKANSYPIHSQLVPGELPRGWVETEALDDSKSRIYAVDCEFCDSEDGKELTRISIVNFNGGIVYDTYVKPSVPITNYLTKFSGVTEGHLDGVETTLGDVQRVFVNTITSSDILVGHSLESDLNVLKIRHPRIVDTSLCYQHARGPPSKPGLKWLCKTYLSRDIQQGEMSGDGHSSVEDANACMDLVKLKIIEGKLFGTNYHEAPCLKRINEARAQKSREPITQLIVDYKFPGPEVENCTQYQVETDEEVIDHFTRHVDQNDLFILNMRELEASRGWESVCEREFTVEESYQNLNRRLNTVYSLLPSNSLFIICSLNGGDTTIMNSLRQQRKAALSDTSLPEEEKAAKIAELAAKLKQQLEEARKCISFIKVKE